MKHIIIICCAIVVFVTLSCSDDRRFTRQERIDWINANGAEVCKAIALFGECNIRKVTWSDNRFITLVDHENACYSAYLDKDLLPTSNVKPAFAVWDTIIQCYEYSERLGINGIAKGIGIYVSFTDRYCLLIVDDASKHDIFSLTRRQPYFQIKEGWFLFVDTN